MTDKEMCEYIWNNEPIKNPLKKANHGRLNIAAREAYKKKEDLKTKRRKRAFGSN